jgi:hypothetical protein
MENFARRMEQGMPLKGAADSRLTEQSSGGRLGDTFFPRRSPQRGSRGSNRLVAVSLDAYGL